MIGPAAPIETSARFQAGGFFSSEDFHRISLYFIDFHDWVTELLGLLGLLEEVFGFLALLEGGLNHVDYHARRSERSADFKIFEISKFQNFKIQKTRNFQSLGTYISHF